MGQVWVGRRVGWGQNVGVGVSGKLVEHGKTRSEVRAGQKRQKKKK